MGLEARDWLVWLEEDSSVLPGQFLCKLERFSCRYNEGHVGGGGYGGRDPVDLNRGGPGPNPGFDKRGGDLRGGGGGGRPNNLRYEERDYGEYVTNL